MPALSNDRHERFCQESLVDLNGGRAYERVGYKATGRTADAAAARLLANVSVAARVAELQSERMERTQVTADQVVAEYAKIAFANMQDFMGVTEQGDPFIDLSKLTREQAAALAEFDVQDFTDGRGEGAREVKRVKVKLHSKLSALDSLAKHLGMFGPKGTEDDPLHQVVRMPTDEERARRLAELAKHL